VYREWRETQRQEVVGLDPIEWLFETLARYESIIERLAVLADDGDNAAARVGALRAQGDAMLRQTELLVAAGLLPRKLRVYFEREDLARAIDRVVGVMVKHELPVEVVEGMLAVLDDQQDGHRASRAT
jgi:hypothetical protein